MVENDDNNRSERNLDDLFARFEEQAEQKEQRYPFKFLDAYEKEDRDIFFGRDNEVEEIYRKFFKSNILLVYGQSGTGKSSIIHCGLMSKIPPEDVLCIPIRLGNNPLENLVHELRKHCDIESDEPEALLLDIYEKHHKPTALIFDQFEEVFILAMYAERIAFTEMMKSLLEGTLNLKIMLVMRGDYLDHVTELEPSLPDIFSNRVRVEKMRTAQAIQVITQPCYMTGIELEQGVPEAILDRISVQSEIELSYLQVYLDKLFRKATARDKDHIQFTLKDVKEIGDIGDVLHAFLEEQIAGTDDPETYRLVLKTAVSSEGTKKIVSVADVEDALASFGHTVDKQRVATMLRTLVDLRIMRELEAGTRFELRHDSLASKVHQWFTEQEKELIELQNSLNQRVNDFETRGFLLDQNFLRTLLPFEKRLVSIPKYRELINQSHHQVRRARNIKRRLFVAATVCIICVLSFFSWWNVRERIRTEKERDRAEKSEQEAFFKMAQLFKEKAINASANNQWQEAKLFTSASILYQSKARKDLSLSDVSKPDIATDWVLREFLPADRPFTCRMSADGKYVAYLDWESKLIIQDLHTMTDVTRTKKLKLKAQDLLISPNSKYLALQKDKDNLLLLDLTSRKLLHSFTEPNHGFMSMSFSHDSRILLCGQAFGSIEFWDIKKNEVIKTLQIEEEVNNHITAVTLSQDGHKLYAGTSRGSILIWEMDQKTKPVRLKGHHGTIISLALSPDHRWLASGGQDNLVKLWDLETNREVAQFSDHHSKITRLQFYPGSNILASSEIERKTIIRKIPESTIISRIKGRNVEFNHDGQWMITASVDGINVWEHPGTVIAGFPETVASLAISPDNQNFAAGLYDNTVRVYNFSPPEEIGCLKGHEEIVCSVSFSPDGKIIASGAGDGTIRLWGLPSFHEVGVLNSHDGVVYTIAFSPDGLYLASAGDDGLVRIWDIATRIQKTILKGHDESVNCVVFSSDGKHLISGGDDGYIRVWQPDPWHERIAFSCNPNDKKARVTTLAVNSNSEYLTWGESNGEYVVYSLKEMKEICRHKLRRDSRALYTIAFTADSQHVISEIDDYYLRIKGFLNSGSAFDCAIPGHQNSITCLAVSSDGQWLLSGSDDQTIRMYNLPTYLPNLGIKQQFPGTESHAEQLVRNTEKVTGLHLDGIQAVSTDFYFDEAQRYTEIDRPEAACEELLRATKLNPQAAILWYKLSYAYQDAGDFKQALAAAQQAVKLNPNSEKAWRPVGWSYFKAADYANAEKAFRKAISLNEENQGVHFSAALSVLAAGDLERAYTLYQEIADKFPGELLGAIENIDHYLGKKPEFIQSYFIRGYLYKRMKNNFMAQMSFDKFIKEYKGNQKWITQAKNLLKQ